jgi:hypothetical protein
MKKNTLFWTNHWLHRQRIQDIAPRLLAIIRRRRTHSCNVHEALMERKWISDIQGGLTVIVVLEFLQLWTSYSPMSCRSGSAITITGKLQQMGNTQQRWRMRISSWDPSILSHSREYGKHGRHQSVGTSCG